MTTEERTAYEARRDAIAAVRTALGIPALEKKLAALKPDELTYEVRVWVDAIRSGVVALRMPPEPPEQDEA